MEKVKINIKSDKMVFIYKDSMIPLLEIGKADVKRASHVEPKENNGKIEWTADLSPIIPGKVLGPFNTREEALSAEVEWLEDNLGKINEHRRCCQ